MAAPILSAASSLHDIKIVPDDFLIAAIHGSYPLGRRCATLKIVPDDFLIAAIHGSYPMGRRCTTLKIVPDDFFVSRETSM
ncbi:MAG: hypothetical protein M1154_04435 [Gammaproteobacteria bacterium]|nr:hypothetical protein [Gammaproteobacteria bacterium]